MQKMRNLGYGLGLRKEFYSKILADSLQVDWFEVITENFLPILGRSFVPHLDFLLKVRERYPVVLHGVSLSIGSPEKLDRDYLKAVANLARQLDPPWISDHFCFTGIGGRNSHDLLPLSYTQKNIDLVVNRVQEVQDFLGRALVLENVSSYVEFAENEMSEATFISSVVERSGCRLLLDLNNIFVSCQNHGHSMDAFLYALPKHAVAQIHLAGPSPQKGYLIDTHDHPVQEPVWNLFRKSLDFVGPVSTMVEWDEQIPSYEAVEGEILKAKKITQEWQKENGISASALL